MSMDDQLERLRQVADTRMVNIHHAEIGRSGLEAVAWAVREIEKHRRRNWLRRIRLAASTRLGGR